MSHEVVASEVTYVYALTKEMFKAVIEKDIPLRAVPLLSQLSTAQLAEVDASKKIVNFKKGEWVSIKMGVRLTWF
jgi:hypothetical protein